MIAAAAIEGPKGTGVFLPCPFAFSTMSPTTIPMTEAKNRVNNVCTVPNTKPIKRIA